MGITAKISTHEPAARLKHERKAVLVKAKGIDRKKKNGEKPARRFVPREIVTVQSCSDQTSSVDGKTGVVNGATWFKGEYWYTVLLPGTDGCWQIVEAELKSTGAVDPPVKNKPAGYRVRVNKSGGGYLVKDGK